MKPQTLQPGDTIGVMAPSSVVEKEDIEKSKAVLEERGYGVFVHPQTFERHNQSAGSHLQKTLALQGLWQREDINTIWCAGGGNRALNLLNSINFKAMEGKVKPLVGFSDVTALLNSIYAHTGAPTFHGPVFKNLHKMKEEQLTQTLDLLARKTTEIPMNNAKIIREGAAEGILLGGCLSIFQYLINTDDCAPLEGSILFLEDAGDHLSRIDRMFCHLKRSGVFEKIGGLVLGEFHDMQDGERPFGFTLEELIEEYTEKSDIPIIMNAPFGHGSNLFTLPVGMRSCLDTSDKQKAFLKLFQSVA